MKARALVTDAARSGTSEAVDARWRRAVPAVLLALLLAFAFRGALAGRVFYLRDVAQNHAPLRALVADRLRAGEAPLWNPLHGAGTPLLANPNALVFHPTTLLFLALPADTAFAASVVLLTALLALGGLLLARAAGCRPEGSALAAAVLALSGPSASLASLHNVQAAFAFVPLALWALLKASGAGRPGWIAGAAASLAPILIAAEPASLLSYLLFGAILLRTQTGAAGDPAAGRRTAMVLCAVAGLALLLAAPQILPARDLLPLTARGGGFAPQDGMKWSLQPARLLELVVPRLFGDPTRLSPGAWWGRFAFEGGYPFLLSLYVGAAPVLLALIGLCSGGPRWRRHRWFAAAGAFGVLLALGAHGVIYRALFAALPAVRQIRYPERFLLPAIVAIALLAAAGLDRILERGPARRGIPGVLVAAAILAFIAVTCVAASPGLVDAFLTRHAGVPEMVFAGPAGATVRGAMLTSCLWVFAETLVLAAGAALALRSAAAPRGAGYGLVAVAGLSMIVAAAPALSTAAPGWLEAPSPLIHDVERGAGAPRLRHDPRPAGLAIWAKTDEVVWGFRFDRFTYSLLTGHPDRVPTALDEATDRMDLRAHADLTREIDRLPLSDRVKILRVVHAGTLLSYDVLHDPGLTAGPVLEGYSRPPVRVYRVREPLPRVRFRAAARPPAWPGEPGRSLVDREYDPEREVLIAGAGPPATAAPSVPGEPRVNGEVPIAVVEDRPESLRLRLAAPVPGWLVVADAWDPGWRATVDGDPAAILKADTMFRAVAVPAGAHEVTMVYAPPAARRGFLLGGLGALLVLGLAIAGARRGRP